MRKPEKLQSLSSESMLAAVIEAFFTKDDSLCTLGPF
jgi:hypothetical protein